MLIFFDTHTHTHIYIQTNLNGSYHLADKFKLINLSLGQFFPVCKIK